MKSDNVKKGMQQAPHRSLFNALGFTEEEFDRPLVGVVSSYNEIVPGHMNLDKIVAAVKAGVYEAGGIPVVFPAIAGGFIGTHFNRKLSEQGVRRIYLFVMGLLPLISLFNCVTNIMAL